MSLPSVVWVSLQGDWFFSMRYENVNSVGQVCRFGDTTRIHASFRAGGPTKTWQMIEKRGPRLFPSPLCENLGDKTKDQTPVLIQMAPRMCLCSYTACPFGYVLELLSAISCNAMIIGCRRVRIDSVSEWVHYWLVLMTFRWSESFRTISQNGSLSKDVVNRVSDFDFSSSWHASKLKFCTGFLFCFVCSSCLWVRMEQP